MENDARVESGGGDKLSSNEEEPLQLLLELAAGRLGTGVNGLHTSLSLVGGGFEGLKSLRVRRAFAASLRAHLATVQVDSVFRFDPPKYLGMSDGGGGGGGGDSGEGTGGGDVGMSGEAHSVRSPGRLAVPPLLNWGSCRKYTATMWLRPEMAHGGAVTLFRFRSGEGVGVEAILSAATAAGPVSGGDHDGQPPEGEIVVTSFLRAAARKSFSVRCKFGAQAAATGGGGSIVGSLAGVAEEARLGGWRFVAVSHGQPYVKRAGRLRISVDGEVVLETELQYPAGTGQASRDAMSRYERNQFLRLFFMC